MARPKITVEPISDEQRVELEILSDVEARKQGITGKERVLLSKMRSLNEAIDTRVIMREEDGGTLDDRFKKLVKDEKVLVTRRTNLEQEREGGLPAMDNTETRLREQLSRVVVMLERLRNPEEEEDSEEEIPEGEDGEEEGDFDPEDPF